MAGGVETKSGLFRKEAELLGVALSKQSKSILPKHILRRANVMWAKNTQKTPTFKHFQNKESIKLNGIIFQDCFSMRERIVAYGVSISNQ